MSLEKTVQTKNKTFCLFHQKNYCECVIPVTDNKTLKIRLHHAIKFNELNIKFEKDPDEKARREAENERWRARLGQIE